MDHYRSVNRCSISMIYHRFKMYRHAKAHPTLVTSIPFGFLKMYFFVCCCFSAYSDFYRYLLYRYIPMGVFKPYRRQKLKINKFNHVKTSCTLSSIFTIRILYTRVCFTRACWVSQRCFINSHSFCGEKKNKKIVIKKHQSRLGYNFQTVSSFKVMPNLLRLTITCIIIFVVSKHSMFIFNIINCKNVFVKQICFKTKCKIISTNYFQ